MTVGLVTAVLIAVLLSSSCERRTAETGTQTGLLERGMSPGHRLLNLEAGRTLPSNSPRIRRADALLTGVSNRFRTSKDKAAEQALTIRNEIAKEQPEDVLEVLDSALFATEGLAPASVPPLPPVLAAYAKARLGGGSVATARGVARSFVQVTVENAANAPPRR